MPAEGNTSSSVCLALHGWDGGGMNAKELVLQLPNMSVRRLRQVLCWLKTIPGPDRPLLCSEERLWRGIEERLGVACTVPELPKQPIRVNSFEVQAQRGIVAPRRCA